MNMAGLVVLALGIIIFVIAIRGTQSQVFPFFFSNNTNSSGAPNPVNGKCPPGYLFINNSCVKALD